jgi:uncharacterized protein (DUF885 family)
LRTPRLHFLILAALALVAGVPALRAQAPAAPAASAPAASVEERHKELNQLFTDYWEDRLKHSPELASELGDKRYNDQVNDQSVRAINDALARGQTFMMRLAAIDTAGLGDQ